MLNIEVYNAKSKQLGSVRVNPGATVKDVKAQISKLEKGIAVGRQSIRLTLKGKDVKDDAVLSTLELVGSKLYVKDLGRQISWRFVFLCEYLGPLVVYLLFYVYQREQLPSIVPHIAAVCWSGHYAKRLLETVFVHRFSHSTMPFTNLFKNCGYYWGFTAYVAYHVNHPFYTAPNILQVLFGLGLFSICEIGNLSIHLLLRDLRPPGTHVRKIPIPNSNPLTKLYNFVSCPNYTYEYGAWLGFAIMTSCLPALLFAAAGMFQMTIWALAKHRNYKKEFSNYPRQRKAILPYML